MIYRLDIKHHYHNNDVIVFDGPECNDFQALCNSLMDKAVLKTLDCVQDRWIGIGEIGDNLIILLEGLGYKKINCETAIISGNMIIEDLNNIDHIFSSPEQSIEKIIKYNDNFKTNLYRKTNLL